MQKFRSRKPNRLQGYDYSQNGAYFITIGTKNREHLFGEIIFPVEATAPGRPHDAPYVQLSPMGQCVDETIKIANRNGVIIDKYVIMPNHLHLIIVLTDAGDRRRSPLQYVVRNIKSYVTKWEGFSPWQKSFYDHIIRDETAYIRIAEYIKNNPAKWVEDRFFNKEANPQ
jgi:REP element-mobilizing transposase RayT